MKVLDKIHIASDCGSMPLAQPETAIPVTVSVISEQPDVLTLFFFIQKTGCECKMFSYIDILQACRNHSMPYYENNSNRISSAIQQGFALSTVTLNIKSGLMKFCLNMFSHPQHPLTRKELGPSIKTDPDFFRLFSKGELCVLSLKKNTASLVHL